MKLAVVAVVAVLAAGCLQPEPVEIDDTVAVLLVDRNPLTSRVEVCTESLAVAIAVDEWRQSIGDRVSLGCGVGSIRVVVDADLVQTEGRFGSARYGAGEIALAAGYELPFVAMHEIGHFLGLKHAPNSLMAASTPNVLGERPCVDGYTAYLVGGEPTCGR